MLVRNAWPLGMHLCLLLCFFFSCLIASWFTCWSLSDSTAYHFVCLLACPLNCLFAEFLLCVGLLVCFLPTLITYCFDLMAPYLIVCDVFVCFDLLVCFDSLDCLRVSLLTCLLLACLIRLGCCSLARLRKCSLTYGRPGLIRYPWAAC